MPFYDDPSIPDGAVLVRGVRSNWTTTRDGVTRLNSQTFKDGLLEASCFVLDEVGGLEGFRLNILPELQLLLRCSLGEATIKAHQVRAAGLWIDRRPDGFKGNPAHVVVCPSNEMNKSQYDRQAGSLAPVAELVSLPNKAPDLA